MASKKLFCPFSFANFIDNYHVAKENYMDEKGEIILYQPDEQVRLEVRLEDETVWLTQSQLVELFQSSKANISEHIKNIYEQAELDEDSTVRNFRTVRQEGNRSVVRNLLCYNLDAIISIGFRVNSKRGIQFRRWANQVLKEYLLRGYSINNRLIDIENRIERRFGQHEHRLNVIDEKIEFFVRTSLPPVEGVFYNGQIFDAYKFASDLIKSAKKSLILIDNYVDESVLLMLSKRGDGVSATVYTQKTDKALRLDLERHNAQYPKIELLPCRNFHDRFLIVDNETVYHIGASLKDLGKKLFAFSKLSIAPGCIMSQL